MTADCLLAKAEPPRINLRQLRTPMSLPYMPSAQLFRLFALHDSLSTRSLPSPVGSFRRKT